MSGKPRLTEKQRNGIKKSFCEVLEKMPIIETACKKVGISRMTFYRWRKRDKKFSKKIEEALDVSRESVNDLAESKIIQGINTGDMRAAKFWLQNNCSRYKKDQKKEEVKTSQPAIFGVDISPFMTGGKKIEEEKKRKAQNADQ